MKIKRKIINDQYVKNRLNKICVLPDHKWCYVPIPKAGCSSVKLMMERMHTGDPDRIVSNIHKNLTVPTPVTLGWPKMRELMADDLFVFTIVREPVKRIVSAYSSKLKTDRYKVQINTALGRSDLTQDVPFEDFVSALEIMDPALMDGHWRPQHLLLMDAGITYDYIGRLETFEESINHIFDATGVARQPIPHRNKKNPKRQIIPTSDQRDRLTKLYRRDFDALNYKIN